MNEEQRPKPTEDWAFCCLKESQVTRLLQADKCYQMHRKTVSDSAVLFF